ncbi:putative General substrate transporter [Seiridium cardinale]
MAKKPYFGLKGAWLTFWVTVACATDMTLFGYDQGVFGGVIVTPDFLDLLGIASDATMQSTVTAIYDVGCFLGAVSVIWIGEPLGRKKTILLGTTIMSIGAVLQIAAFGVPQMIVGRVIAGIGNGMNTSTAPVWQGETSKASWRGKLIVIEMIMNIFGFMLNLESLEPDDPYILAQSKDIQWAVNYEKENTVPWSKLLRGKTGPNGGTSTIRRLILGMGAQAMQQFSGINVTSYYLPLVLIQSVGLDEKLARLLAACNSVSYLLFSTIGIPNVERWGRRKMMMYAAAGQCFCYMIITICIRYNEDPGIGRTANVQWAKGSIAFFFLYYIFFGIGWQGVPWLYPTEINSLSMRTKGAALGTATNWIINFMVVEITPVGIASIGWRFYIIWTVFNASFVPIVYLFYPETADRSLEDVDRFFQDNQNVLIFRDPDAKSSKRPQKYIEHEREEVRRNSSVRPSDVQAVLNRRSVAERANAGLKDEEKGYIQHAE